MVRFVHVAALKYSPLGRGEAKVGFPGGTRPARGAQALLPPIPSFFSSPELTAPWPLHVGRDCRGLGVW